MSTPDRVEQAQAATLQLAQTDAAACEADPQMTRISRIGKRLFDVANCIVSFGNDPCDVPDRNAMAALEAAFCRSLPLSGEAVVAPDTREHPQLRMHRLVIGAPYIRFHAAHPVHKPDGELVGMIGLVDYAPRSFQEADRQLLADLAALAERELQLRSMNLSQIELQKKNKNLRRRSLADPLLGIWNRAAIMRILTIEAVRCEKAGMPLSLIVVDLDYFKKINDTHGHPAGDAVLVKVASRLRSCVRPQEALGRYGGEEFLVVLPGASSAAAMVVAERMRQAIAAQPEAVGNAMLDLSISAGIASTDVFPAATTEELINRADAALYAAKDAGRNRVMQATPDLS